MRYMIRQMKLQEVYGGLNALLSTFYDPYEGSNEEYTKAEKIIKDIIEELGDNFG